MSAHRTDDREWQQLMTRASFAYDRVSAATPGGALLPWGVLEAGLRGLLAGVGGEMETAARAEVARDVLARHGLAWLAELRALLPEGAEKTAVVTAAELVCAGALALCCGRRLPGGLGDFKPTQET